MFILIYVAAFRAHENAIFDVAWMTGYKGDFNIVTASGDRTVAIWDVETLKRQCVIACHEQSLRTVCAHPDVPGLLATGGRDGKICIHDHRCDLNFPVSIIVGAHAKPQKSK
jgi:WD40 repeat protein